MKKILSTFKSCCISTESSTYSQDMLDENSFLPQKISRITFWLLTASLFSLLLYKTYLLFTWQIILPKPSDPLQYMGPSIFGNMSYSMPSFPANSMPTSGWPWLDRITMIIGLRLINLIFNPGELSGPIYCGILEMVLLLASCLWLTINRNMVGAILFCTLYIFNPAIITYSTTICPETGLITYSLLAYIFLFFNSQSGKSYPIIAGIFAACAAFSKATGVFTPMALLIFILLEKNRTQLLIRYLSGVSIGTFFLMILYIILFGQLELLTTIQRFFLDGIQTNYIGRTGFNNFVSFIEHLSKQEYLPGLLGLLLCAHAARYKRFNRLFWFASSFLIALYVVYYGTERGYKPMTRYIYPVIVFAHLYIAMHLGELFHRSKMITKKTTPYLIGSFIPLIFIGECIGATWSPVGIFEAKSISEDFPRLVGFLYGCGSISILYLLAMLQFHNKKSAITIYATCALIFLWTPAFPGGVTRYIIEAESFTINRYYERAKLALLAPNKQLDLYVTDWQGDKRIHRASWAYHFFFDPLYKENRYNDIPEKKKRRVRFLNNPKGLINGNARYILTDVPEKIIPMVKSSEKDYKVIEEYVWNQKTLSLLKNTIRKRKNG